MHSTEERLTKYSLLSEEQKQRRRDYAREYRFRKEFGISTSDYEEMLGQQGGRCALCGTTESKVLDGKQYRMSVDHDHETGKLRQLLCNDCNLVLGMLRDDPRLLRRAADYLDLHRDAPRSSEGG